MSDTTPIYSTTRFDLDAYGSVRSADLIGLFQSAAAAREAALLSTAELFGEAPRDSWAREGGADVLYGDGFDLVVRSEKVHSDP